MLILPETCSGGFTKTYILDFFFKNQLHIATLSFLATTRISGVLMYRPTPAQDFQIIIVYLSAIHDSFCALD